MKKFWKRKSDRVSVDSMDLIAQEQYADDAYYFDRHGHSIARIDPDDMNALEVLPGAWIRILGGNDALFGHPYRCRTVVKCLPLQISLLARRDKGKHLIRTDELTRRNAKVRLGDPVTIRKENLTPISMFFAERVVLMPLQAQPYPFSSADLRTIAERNHGRSICTGNSALLLGLPFVHGFSLIPFGVLSYVCNGEDLRFPNDPPAFITEKTEIVLGE